jgi:hypothetical protein
VPPSTPGGGWLGGLWGIGSDWSSFAPTPSGGGGDASNGSSTSNSSDIQDNSGINGGFGGPNFAVSTIQGESQNKSQRIFNFLNAADALRVEKMLEEIMQNCFGKALIDRMVGAGIKLGFEFISGTSSYYHPVSKTVQLGTSGGGAATLFHELFHAYQATKYSNYSKGSDWDKNLMNVEIEAYLIQYHIYKDHPIMRIQYSGAPIYDEIKDLAQYIDSSGKITDAARANYAINNVVIPAFKTSPIYKDFSFNENMSYSNMFSNMYELWIASEDCRKRL